ncbi:MAG: FAD-dependent monooxygenase [Candidatus Obscuribacterales bacterium]|nr:FAD-dependent monooxygenase [Candidatus Obscuribacterales bacterium]
MTKSDSVEVLVVGGGPTGLTAACELARRGVSFRFIEKLDKANDKSRALVVHARTLELLRIMGCADKFVENGFAIRALNIFDGEKRIAHLPLNQIDSHYQFALGIPQYETEKLLQDHLNSLGGKLERAKELSSVQEMDEHLIATIRSADGSEEKIKCSYMIACDGAHSTVRKAVNEPFEGGEYQETFQLADVQVDWGDKGVPGELFAFSSATGNAAFFPMPKSRWRVVVILPENLPEEELKKEPELSEIQAKVDEVLPWKIKLSDPVWLANFKIRYRKVRSYRHGRIFLAGDAAHVHSPFGGQGMNTGMQDAYNIAWKLALAAKGQATEELLDSYQFERHAVAAQLLKSVDMMTRVNLLRAPIAREIRNRLAPLLISQEPVQAKLRKFITEIGINYRKSPVVAESTRSLVRAALSTTASEEPKLGDWFEFSQGPHAGDRAPDAHMSEPNGNTIETADLFKTCKHTLLLLTGDAPDSDVYKHFSKLAQEAAGKYGNFLEIKVITSELNPPEGLDFRGTVYSDPDYSVHERYGAGAPCMYIIRPDAYVGYRSQPAEIEGVEEYFNRIIRA